MKKKQKTIDDSYFRIKLSNLTFHKSMGAILNYNQLFV